VLKNLVVGAIVASCLAAVQSHPVMAQANRTFVSGLGSDANPCSLPAPCRSFAQAITQTNPSGEIVALDSAGYGAVTITKAITITAPDGIEAGITTSSATIAITISAGPNDVVNLRGLTLEGGGVGTNGIVLASGGALNIQNCVVRDFTNIGIALEPVGPSPDANYTISDTTVVNNTSTGIYFGPASVSLPNGTAVFLSLKHDTLIGNGDGFRLNAGVGTGFQGFALATLVDIAAWGNKSNAFAVQGAGNNTALGIATLYRSQAAGSPVGVLADGMGAAVFLSGTVLNTVSGYATTNGGGIGTTADNVVTFPNGAVTLNPFPFK
jgi:hypothetical protein